ncbi:hypothetical protein B5K03_27125 [Rhizobium phaseoli]|nr:hypothetical protein B5K03_27125 [Rhizobium phaseoli]
MSGGSSLGRQRPSAGCDAAGRGSSSCDEEHPPYDDIMMQDQHVMKMVMNLNESRMVSSTGGADGASSKLISD